MLNVDFSAVCTFLKVWEASRLSVKLVLIDMNLSEDTSLDFTPNVTQILLGIETC
jgi:hypothetical protein